MSSLAANYGTAEETAAFNFYFPKRATEMLSSLRERKRETVCPQTPAGISDIGEHLPATEAGTHGWEPPDCL